MGLPYKNYVQGEANRRYGGAQVGGSGAAMAFLVFVVLPVAGIYSYLGAPAFWLSLILVAGSVASVFAIYFYSMTLIWLRLLHRSNKNSWKGETLSQEDDETFRSIMVRGVIGAGVCCLVLIVFSLSVLALKWVSVASVYEVLFAPKVWISVAIVISSVVLTNAVYFLLMSLVGSCIVLKARLNGFSGWYVPHEMDGSYALAVFYIATGAIICCVLLGATALLLLHNGIVSTESVFQAFRQPFTWIAIVLLLAVYVIGWTRQLE